MQSIADIGDIPGRPPLSDAEKQAIAVERNAELAARGAKAAAVAAVLYRRHRAIAYRDEMGAETGDFINTIGDVLDIVLGWAATEIGAGRAQATPEIEAALTKRAEIKVRFPRPDLEAAR